MFNFKEGNNLISSESMFRFHVKYYLIDNLLFYTVKEIMMHIFSNSPSIKKCIVENRMDRSMICNKKISYYPLFHREYHLGYRKYVMKDFI